MLHLLQYNPLLFEPGDQLTQAEFLARWERMPDLKFAELIDGCVYMPSPVSYDHMRRDGQMQSLLAMYAARTASCEVLPNGTWLMGDSAPQPDIALRLLPDHGGRTQIGDAGLPIGAPELIVEISRSSRSYDLGPKLALYQRAAVHEYIVVLLEEQRIEWRMLNEGHFVIQTATTDGVLKSKIFPGLWLDQRAFWNGDIAGMLVTLEKGLAERGKT